MFRLLLFPESAIRCLNYILHYSMAIQNTSVLAVFVRYKRISNPDVVTEDAETLQLFGVVLCGHTTTDGTDENA